jgi:hypothetical protein
MKIYTASCLDCHIRFLQTNKNKLKIFKTN